MIYNWINNPTTTFFKRFFRFYIIVIWIDSNTSSISLSLIIVSAFEVGQNILCFVSSSSFISLNSKTSVFMNLNPFNSVHESFSLFLVIHSVYLSCSSQLNSKSQHCKYLHNRYSVAPRTRKFEKGYGLLQFQINLTNTRKSIGYCYENKTTYNLLQNIFGINWVSQKNLDLK